MNKQEGLLYLVSSLPLFIHIQIKNGEKLQGDIFFSQGTSCFSKAVIRSKTEKETNCRRRNARTKDCHDAVFPYVSKQNRYFGSSDIFGK